MGSPGTANALTRRRENSQQCRFNDLHDGRLDCDDAIG